MLSSDSVLPPLKDENLALAFLHAMHPPFWGVGTNMMWYVLLLQFAVKKNKLIHLDIKNIT
jgi:hypothetical protein